MGMPRIKINLFSLHNAGVWFLRGQGIFLFVITSNLALESTQPHMKRIPNIFFERRRPGFIIIAVNCRELECMELYLHSLTSLHVTKSLKTRAWPASVIIGRRRLAFKKSMQGNVVFFFLGRIRSWGFVSKLPRRLCQQNTVRRTDILAGPDQPLLSQKDAVAGIRFPTTWWMLSG